MNDQEPGRRILVAGEKFRFACNSKIDCFTRCCRDADRYLYPYDIIRLKARLGMDSETFLDTYAFSAFRDNPYFPSVMLKMSDKDGHPCPFLGKSGCTVYEDRPFSCRAYPLEPAVSKAGEYQNVAYFLAKHAHCHGHDQGREWTVNEWIADQEMVPYNEMNVQWVEVDVIFRQNLWGDRGTDSPALKMAFMACFNVDRFKGFVFESTFLDRFNVPLDRMQKTKESDTQMMLLGFDWVKAFLAGKGPLRQKT